MQYALYDAPFAPLYCLFDGERLNALSHMLPSQMASQSLPRHWQQQFDAYFSGSLKEFNYPPSPHGSPFQCAVWLEIAHIPYGETTTYSELATKLASHPRAVGQACGKNPLPIVIPCHRVIAKNGALGGFSMGNDDNKLAIKQYLLRLEGVLP